eukprot:CAMPEP_0204252810 /NCGR_PEP_ID=MMETSP0468-20130131/1460_1 /ASSEMBLY_ACC=CAM_ASM_000383 /TAXON_ID=2969 /ORGANISM="Oxyrrhis marina" /LENGTH=72 /DNA_ID=CAMNT_0051226293 /DNA_START=62 /DNA_END=280 /DNA_ORIENTATION=-
MTDRVNYIGGSSGLWAGFGMLSTSSVFFGVWTWSRRKEWVDIMLDYCHHKRAQYPTHTLDRVAVRALRMLKI